MTTFLFWNLKRKPLQNIIANLAIRHQIDIIILAECIIAPSVLLKALNPLQVADYHYSPDRCQKIQIYTRFSYHFTKSVFEQNRVTIRHLALPGLVDILLAAVHSPSKRDWSEKSQYSWLRILASAILAEERRIGHTRTILVGDFNINPFDAGMIDASGLHAVMSRSIALNVSRIVQGDRYPYFYNPMWNLLGDTSPGPPGTYYYNNSEMIVYFWNMFDQVLVRPALLERFNNQNLKILQTDGEVSFLSRIGIPDDKIASDHLPLLFSVSL